MDTHPSRHSNPLRARLHLFGVTAAMILALCATLTWPATAAPATNAFTGSVSVFDYVTFAPSGNMSVARSEHTATLLPNGKVLVVGGTDRSSYLASAELYDPASGTWSSTGSMIVGRTGHTATMLPNGKVLVAGGFDGSSYLASAELYDPATGIWSNSGSMTIVRVGHTATLLPSGKVLVAGGAGGSSYLASAELYDPATGMWSGTGSMTIVRFGHTATLLPSGKVLVAGGRVSNYLASADLYDPITGTWSNTGSMATARVDHIAILLNNGKVLVAGGQDTSYGSMASARAELYDPTSGTWSSTGSMAIARTNHTATLLSTGKVLVAGGRGPNYLASAELYDPASCTWSPTSSMASSHDAHTATLLPTGKVLVAGGIGSDGGVITSTKLVTFYPANTFTATLTLPSGWLNSTAVNAQFVGTSSAAALEAGSLSNDATTWGAWVTAGSGVAASTTWDVGGEGANKPVSLRLRDVNGQVATVATGSVNVDLTKPTSSMTALLPRSTASIALVWSGSDALSGVAGYDLQVRAGSGAWTDVLTNTLATSTTYNGVAGTTYAFRVRAKDVAGNIEDWPVDADTTTLAGGTSVGGSIYTATTWSASQSPYLVTSSIVVFPNTILTIEPGVEVYFSANTGLTVRGNLLSLGTATKPITLTANVATPVKGSWQGVALATQQGGKATLAFSTIQYASSALSVECCWGGGPVTITDSTFRENNTALSGYAGWAIQVKRSLFENNISAVNSADKVIRDSVFRNNQYGLNATERVSVYNSVFTGNQVALYGGRGTVTYCTMTQNGTGVQAFFEGFTLTYNTIANNTVGVILGQYGTYTPPVQNNNIYGNATYNLKNTGPANKDVLNNWWGTVDTGLIETGLFDGKDDSMLGLLISQPIRTQAVDITPPLPTVGFSQATSSIGEAGTAVITVTVSDEHRFPISVAYATSNGTATAGSDYTPISGTLTFPPDQLSHTISVPILNDTLDESNETVNLTLSTPVSATLSTTSILAISIVDDDAPPTVQFSTTALTVDEGVGTAIITATLSSSSALTVTVPYATSNRTATAGSDYTPISGTLTFAPNQTSQTIRLPIVDDTLDEVDETVALALSTPTNATLGASSTSTVTIRDNDAPPTVQFSTAALTVDEGVGTAIITATLSSSSALIVTVPYATTTGTATAGSDYTATSGTLTFVPNQTSQTIRLPITNDTLDEVDETVALALSTPTNATLGASSTSTVTIRDNDAPPTVQFSTATLAVNESAGTAVFTATLSTVSSLPITVVYATSDGTASAPADYTPISGTLTFAPNQTRQTVTVAIVNDTLIEADETVALTLSTPTNASLGTSARTILTINDNDGPPTVRFSAANLAVDEGIGTAVITATLSPASTLPVTVAYATSDGMATAGSDYTPISGTLTFAPNQTSQTIRLPITNDTLDEVDETVALALSTPTNATLGASSTSTVTIRDNDAPPTVQFSATALMVDEGVGTAIITATLSGPSGLTVTVPYATTTGTATAGSDYIATSGTLTFAPNQTSQTIRLPIVEDTLDEVDETVALALNTPTNASLGTSARTILTINDNDGPPTVRFSAANLAVDEGVGTAMITATLSSSSALTVTVPYAITTGTATADSDYTATSGSLTFAPNQASQVIRLPVVDDMLDEVDEMVALALSTPTNATLGASSTSTVTIRDNDAPPTVQFSAAALTVNESAGTAMFTATLSTVSSLPITVAYATSDGTATADSDYTPISGTLTFAPNQTSQTIRLPIVDDTLDEVDETVALALSTPINATLGALATSTVTIRDNDAPPTVQFSAAALTVDESAGTAVFTATLSTVSSLPITVAYATSDGTASAPADYTPISGTLTFAPHQTSQTVTVAIVNDTFIEADETVALTLSTPTNASLGTSARTILTINDNDGPPTVRFSAANLTVDEGIGTAVITATLSPSSTLPVTVAYATSDGTATAGSDYTPISGTLTFAPNQTSQTIRLPITNDTLDEVDETLILTLSTPTNAVVGTAPRTTLTILDNDGPTVDVRPSSIRVREGESTAVLTVTLSAPSVQPITVAYASHDGTATAGRDYTAISGTLTFAPGEQNKELSLPITDDTVLLEADETVQISLVTPTGATLGATTASVTIVDNDVNTPPVDIPAPTDPSQPVTVPVNTPAGTVRLTFDNLGSSGVITTQVSVAPLTNAPSSFTLLGFNYEISTSEISFGKATLRLPYRDSDVAAAGIPEESLRLLHFDHGQWKDITTELDTAANIITGVTESFSPFVLGVQDTQQCTISINSGATYSGKLAVQVFSNTPNAAQILVSNDGGFTGAQWHPYRSAMPWTITDPGNRIVTLVTYVRLRDATGTLLCGGLSMSDDVIYDPLAPTVSVTIIQSAQQAQLATQAGGPISVNLTATDQPGGSGVADMQLSTHADFSGAVWQPFSATASLVAQPGDTVYVRVRDGVGNTSGVAPTTLAGNYSVFLPVIMR